MYRCGYCTAGRERETNTEIREVVEVVTEKQKVSPFSLFHAKAPTDCSGQDCSSHLRCDTLQNTATCESKLSPLEVCAFRARLDACTGLVSAGV